MFAPVYSPDGTKVAVMWNRRPGRGIWVIDTRDHQERLVYNATTTSLTPIAWSTDGTAIFAAEGKAAAARGRTTPLGETVTDVRIVMIPANGVPKTILALPAAEVGGIAMTPDARKFVYAVYSSRSDVWIVDDFDPASSTRTTAR
jgi:Tol biopolymer transport system component